MSTTALPPVAFDTLNLSADLHNNRAELGWRIRLTNTASSTVRCRLPTHKGDVIWAVTSYSQLRQPGRWLTRFRAGEKAAGCSTRTCGWRATRKARSCSVRCSNGDIDGNFMPSDMQPLSDYDELQRMSSTLNGFAGPAGANQPQR